MQLIAMQNLWNTRRNPTSNGNLAYPSLYAICIAPQQRHLRLI